MKDDVEHVCVDDTLLLTCISSNNALARGATTRDDVRDDEYNDDTANISRRTARLLLISSNNAVEPTADKETVCDDEPRHARVDDALMTAQQAIIIDER